MSITEDGPTARELRAALVDGLTRQGALRSARWITAFRQVPRHVFVPRFLLDLGGTGGHAAVEGSDPEQYETWIRYVYTDEPLATELDGGTWVSSSSQPSLMAAMLEALEVSGGERVLEVGTGTGYNAALVCAGLGDAQQVTSIDIDAELVESARRRLALLGYRPHLAVGDGAQGLPERAPFDRIIATCALPAVPPAWLRQAGDGGLIMVSLYRDLGGGALAVLRVQDGEASGHFAAFSAGFMPTRTHSRTDGLKLLEHHLAHGGGKQRPAVVDPAVLDDDGFAMLATLRVPARSLWLHPEGEPPQFWLLSRDGSWAFHAPEAGTAGTVVQGGPRRLWDALEETHTDWATLGKPPRYKFGLSVTASGEHTLWHGSPSGPSWPVVR
jgi:methyltransferase of ATP-grasp peptide maturase system